MVIFVRFDQTKCQSFHKRMLLKDVTTYFIFFNESLLLWMDELQKYEKKFAFVEFISSNLLEN